MLYPPVNLDEFKYIETSDYYLSFARLSDAKRVDKIVEACGKDFVTVCPGIRPQSAAVGDQKRVVTPAQAIQNGAHYMVVGRPITQAENPKQSATAIVKELENAQEGR